ncbi:hypothetical protein [Demequina zhanjiangensis]|uniref:Uncharacterized protein n=1 Tax=Demequina zhanjiangensis TaxID=3051659 RepID=A0ABT8G1H0_9MICO|nr:hypothetical protein [Demequina sp. SYSU T00b26]MDN4472564.1 hypothetical protein [Demequina sp. SYSU T00b26]
MIHSHMNGHGTRRGLRAAVVAAATALLLLGSAGAVSASPPQGYDLEDVGVGRFYGGWDYGVLLFTHDPVDEICMGAPEPIESAKMFTRADGSLDFMISALQVPIYLYHSNMDAFDFLDMNCAAILDGDPTTVPDDYFASGEANFKERVTIHPNGDEEHFNGVNGFATDMDGQSWKVRTWADFEIIDGDFIGHPSEFQGLIIHKIRR